MTDLSRLAARGAEQTLIELLGRGRNGGTLVNNNNNIVSRTRSITMRCASAGNCCEMPAMPGSDAKTMARVKAQQGGVWAYLTAASMDEIRREFPALRVYETPLTWMSAADVDRVRATMTIDIADRLHPFLAALAHNTSH